MLLIILSFGASSSFGALTVKEAWVQLYNHTSSNALVSVRTALTDANGDVIIAGTMNTRETDYGNDDQFVVKYSGRTGAFLWKYRYGTPDKLRDYVIAAAIDPAGDIVITGTVVTEKGGADYRTAKLSGSTGALLWEKTYNGPANRDDSIAGLVINSHGDIFVTGSSTGENTGFDYYTVCYSGSDGEVRWANRLDGPASGEDVARSITLGAEDDLFVTGSSVSQISSADYFTARLSQADGTVAWTRSYDSLLGDDRARHIASDKLGDVVVTGYSVRTEEFYTVKYSKADGLAIWERRDARQQVVLVGSFR